MAESATPRTDANSCACPVMEGCECCSASVARELERELALKDQKIVELEAEIQDARSLAYNSLPGRTEEDAKSDLCEQVELLGQKIAELERTISYMDAAAQKRSARVESLQSQLAEQRNVAWIPISVRPERDATVIYWSVAYGHGFWRIADEWRDEHHLVGTTHWMPIPAPPKEKAMAEKRCPHGIVWLGNDKRCMACRAENAEARAKSLQSQLAAAQEALRLAHKHMQRCLMHYGPSHNVYQAVGKVIDAAQGDPS